MGSTGISTLSVTIPATGWSTDSTAVYPKYCDITISGLTANDVARVNLSTAEQATAVACGLCPTCETMSGKLRLRAVSVPAASMAAQCRVEKA